jgi:hypothetical protein
MTRISYRRSSSGIPGGVSPHRNIRVQVDVGYNGPTDNANKGFPLRRKTLLQWREERRQQHEVSSIGTIVKLIKKISQL